jgi:hypothetical protein
VPSEYTTINQALDASAFGDTVLVAAGTYSVPETRDVGYGVPITSLMFLRDGVVVLSEEGPEATILDLAGQGTGRGWVALADELPSEQTKVKGFTLTGAPLGGRGLMVQSSGKVTVEDCVFRDLDSGESWGAGVRSDISRLAVIGCQFRDCHAPSGGAIFQTDPEISVESSLFERCSELAVRASGSEMFPGVVAVIRSCVFRENESSAGGGALGLTNYQQVTVEDCVFEANYGTGSGAGLSISSVYSAQVWRNVFVDNHAEGYAGGVFLQSTHAMVENNTFYNCSEGWTSGGGALKMYGGAMELHRNVVVACTGGPAVRLFSGTITTACNVFWDNPEGDVEGFVLGATDRVVDPQFCDPDAGDLTVAESSPCLPANSGGCDLIGALGQGCGSISVENTSWARIKALYRPTSK